MRMNKQEREAARVRAQHQQQRRSDRCAHEEHVQMAASLAAVKSLGFRGSEEDGVERLFDDDIANLPKWLGDIVEQLGARYGRGPCHEAAETAAEAAAERAYDEAYNATYEASYTKAFNDSFAFQVASHEGRTYYDENGVERIRVDGPAAPNVVDLRGSRDAHSR